MADTWRVITTGSRTWRSAAVITRELSALRAAYGTRLTVAAGDAKTGADMIVKAQCARLGIPFSEYAADWARYGRRAGYVRNQAMVADGADQCYAFPVTCQLVKCARRPRHWTHGTEHCARAAAAAGIPVTEVTT